MAQSVYKSILDGMNSQVQGLNLIYQSTPIAVAVRKLPRAEAGLDTLPLICIVPEDGRGESTEPWSSEDSTGVLVKYPASAVLVMANNADFTDTDMDLTARFREQIRRLFQWGIRGATLPSGANCFFGEVMPEPFYAREKLNEQYSYSGLSFRHWCNEPRTN